MSALNLPPFLLVTLALTAIAAGVLVALSWRALRAATRAQRMALGVVRGLLFLSVVAAVADGGLSVERSRRLRPAVVVLADGSLSMAIRDVQGGKTRAHSAQAAARELSRALGDRADVVAFRFGAATTRLAEPSGLAPTEPRTDLAAAVREGIAETGKQRVADVWLLSDGQDTEGHTAGDIAAEASGLPLFAVPIGSPEPPLDVDVSYVLAPREAVRGEPVRITADVRLGGKRTIQAKVALQRGQTTVVGKQVALAPGFTRVMLETTPTQIGLVRYEARVEPIPGELTRQNNERAFFLRVVQGERRVLWVDRPRQEFAAARRAVERLAKLKLDIYLKKAPGDGWWLEGQPPRKGVPLPGRAKLAQYDAVVIGDLSAPMLGSSFAGGLAALAREKGIGLALLAGPESLGGDGVGQTALAALLPFDPAQAPYAPEPGRVQAASIPPFGDLALPWSSLPSLAGLGVARAPRPGGKVALEADVPGRGRLPLAAARPQGGGKAFMLLTDSTWRWVRSEPATPRTADAHGQFWRALIWWLSTAADGKPVEVQLDRDVYTVGDTARIAALVRDAAFEPVADADVTAVISGPGDPRAEVRCYPVGDTPGRYEGAFSVPAEGAYKVELRASRRGASLGEAAAEFAAEPAVVEYRHPELNRALLSEIARRTGGKVVRPDEVGQVAAALPIEGRTVRLRTIWQPTRTWPFLLAFLVLAGLDWGLRRRWGLG